MSLASLSKEMKSFLEKTKPKHKKHYKKHHLKKHHKHHAKKTGKHHHHHQTIVNIYNGVADKTQSRGGVEPPPRPAPTGQGIHADVPYSNLVNQRKVYERRFADLEKRKRETDAHSPFKDQYDAEQGEQDFRPETTETGTDPRKAGKPRDDEKMTTRARDINDPTDEGTPVYEEEQEASQRAYQFKADGQLGTRAAGRPAGKPAPPEPTPRPKPSRKKLRLSKKEQRRQRDEDLGGGAGMDGEL